MTYIVIALLLAAAGAGALFSTGRQVERVGFASVTATGWIIGLGGFAAVIAAVALVAH